MTNDEEGGASFMEKKPNERKPINPEMHATLLVIIGGYLAYLGYQIYDGYRQGAGGMDATASVAFAIFFALAGLGVVVYGVRLYLLQRRKKNEEEAQTSEEEKHSK